ncbi:unnamed protein product [Amoebophrya sp. A120]|nr:unnamed protein product [Amoebophrya sp. A120]|eukprot:GSA120T00019937001.1
MQKRMKNSCRKTPFWTRNGQRTICRSGKRRRTRSGWRKRGTGRRYRLGSTTSPGRDHKAEEDEKQTDPHFVQTILDKASQARKREAKITARNSVSGRERRNSTTSSGGGGPRSSRAQRAFRTELLDQEVEVEKEKAIIGSTSPEQVLFRNQLNAITDAFHANENEPAAVVAIREERIPPKKEKIIATKTTDDRGYIEEAEVQPAGSTIKRVTWGAAGANSPAPPRGGRTGVYNSPQPNEIKTTGQQAQEQPAKVGLDAGGVENQNSTEAGPRSRAVVCRDADPVVALPAAAQQHLFSPPLYTCPLCFEDFPETEMITLDCKHRFCSEDFLNFLTSKITDGQVADDELTCPMPECREKQKKDPSNNLHAATTIPVHLIETELRLKKQQRKTIAEGERLEELWEKFLQFRLKIFQPKTGKIVLCPKCETQTIVNQNLISVTCPECSHKFCPKCGEKPHPKFAKCEDYKQYLLETSQGDQKLETLLEEENWCRCPVCSIPVERESGCNFMQCPSPLCRNKTFFCYVCGEKVDKDNHYAHYQKGPYEDFCVNRPEGVKGKKAVYEGPPVRGGGNQPFFQRLFARDRGDGEDNQEQDAGHQNQNQNAGWFQNWFRNPREQVEEVVEENIRALNDNLRGGYQGYDF